MTEFKVVIGDAKSHKSYQKVVSDENANNLVGHKIGDKISGHLIGLEGYELEITGGSDYCGFPMVKAVNGIGTRKVLAIKGTGLTQKGKGTFQRKRVAMNTIHEKTAQINIKILKYGHNSIEDALGIKKEVKEEKAEAQ
ncbi:30S ribosomal protein S6e [Candidatus Woesearchaeota archaeon]|nr:30S ribosomal protein S6e [Candidatus Woesearchaeota archaeon]